jgi:long-chain acyl-CoA synthetase
MAELPTNFGDLFAAHADTDRTALVDLAPAHGPVRWSYRDLERMCGAVAGWLLGTGRADQQRVGVLARNRAEYLFAYYGIMRAGCAVVPLNAKLPAAQLRHCVDDAAVELVLCDDERRSLGPAGCRAVCFDDAAAWAAVTGTEPVPSVAVADDDVAVQMYTSGSTGRPKGVLLTHGGQRATFANYIRAGFVAADSTNLVAAPLYHKNAAVSMKLTWVQGATAVLLPRFDPRAYLHALADLRCTTMMGVPTMFALVMNEPDLLAELDLSAVDRITIGSAPLTPALMEEIRSAFPTATVTNGYGTTEVIAVFGPHPDGLPTPDVSVGHPLDFVEVRLVDPDDPSTDGDEGELWVRSPGAMLGYHHLPEVTAARLSDVWYRTGDVLRRDDDGFHWFVGRVDDMFVCGGENVYPGEVEQLLERHPAVHQASVVPVSDRVKGALPVAYVVPVKGRRLTAEEVKRWALDNGPAYAHPRHVELVDELPLAGTAKIDRRALTDRAETAHGDGSA